MNEIIVACFLNSALQWEFRALCPKLGNLGSSPTSIVDYKYILSAP